MKELIFVYNANSGIVNAIFDSAHKLFSPSTYACDLCALTYHSLGEKKKWKDFRKDSKTAMRFLHKDEFQSEFPDASFNLPVILRHDYELQPFITAEELNGLHNTDALITEIQNRLNL